MSCEYLEKGGYGRKVAEAYEKYGRGAVTDWVLGFLEVYRHLVPIKNKKVLDYGCGTGKFCLFLSDCGADVTGVDISEEMLKKARTIDTAKRIAYQQINSGSLPIVSDNSMDYVTMTFVLCILDIPSEMKKILQELYRVLKKDGKLVMLNVNWEKAKGRDFLSFQPDAVETLIPGKPLHVTLKGEPSIRVEECFWPTSFYCDLFKEVGFKDVTLDEHVVPEGDKEHRWLDEREYAPFAIITGRKP